MVLWSWSLWSSSDSLKGLHSFVWYGLVLYPYTAERRDVLGNTTPEEISQRRGFWTPSPERLSEGEDRGQPLGPRGIYLYQNHTLAECTNIHILSEFRCYIHLYRFWYLYIQIFVRIKINMNVTLWNRCAYKIQIQMGNEELDKGGQQWEDRGQVRLARAPEAAYQYTRQANRTIFYISFYCFSF